MAALGVSLLTSYVAAVLTNTLRITVAMWLGAHPVAQSRLSAADVHRIEGITVYFAGLVLLYELVQCFERRAVTSSTDARRARRYRYAA